MLTRGDRNSRYIVARSDGFTWKERAYSADALRAFTPHDKASYYVTRNGFVSSNRKAENCRQVNALMFDIDCHNADWRTLVPEVVALLTLSFDDGVLPRPTMLVYTGRGVQAYYVLATTTSVRLKSGTLNERGLSWVRSVEERLAMRYEELLGAIPGAEVDGSVYDLSRVSRIPGTYNWKAQDMCRLLDADGPHYSLDELSSALPHVREGEKRKASFKPLRFDKLMMLRLKKIEELQEYRGFDCRGHRELMNFVYYNTATQVYGADRAWDLLVAYNARFHEPLSAAVLNNIKTTVDGNVVPFGAHKGERGHYVLGAKTIIEKLGMTQLEMAAIGFFASKRAHDRAEAKKRTAERRQARNQLIEQLYYEGHCTYEEIADRAQCCVRTVASVVKAVKERAREVGRKHITVETHRSFNAMHADTSAREQDFSFRAFIMQKPVTRVVVCGPDASQGSPVHENGKPWDGGTMLLCRPFLRQVVGSRALRAASSLPAFLLEGLSSLRASRDQVAACT